MRTYAGEGERKMEHLFVAGGSAGVYAQPLREISVELLKKLKIEPHKAYMYHSWAHTQRILFLSHSTEAIPSGHERAQLDEAWSSESPVLWYGSFVRLRRVICPRNCGFFDNSQVSHISGFPR